MTKSVCILPCAVYIMLASFSDHILVATLLLCVPILQKTFCARMVSYASHVISRGTTATTTSSTMVDMGPGLGAELDPQAQVTLYHLATVMNTLVQNSSSLVQLLRTHFTEEFRQV